MNILTKNGNITLVKRIGCILYLFLTIMRLFTASVCIQREEDPTIILKCIPTNEITFGGTDTEIQKQYEKHIWFKNGLYIDLIHLGKMEGVNNVYLFLMDTWLILTGIFVIIYTSRCIFGQYKKRNFFRVKDKKCSQ